MAVMFIDVDGSELEEDGKVKTIEKSKVRLNAFLNNLDGPGPATPSLSISIGNEIEGSFICCYVDSIADIDAIRVYCEMTIAQFKSGDLY